LEVSGYWLCDEGDTGSCTTGGFTCRIRIHMRSARITRAHHSHLATAPDRSNWLCLFIKVSHKKFYRQPVELEFHWDEPNPSLYCYCELAVAQGLKI